MASDAYRQRLRAVGRDRARRTIPPPTGVPGRYAARSPDPSVAAHLHCRMPSCYGDARRGRKANLLRCDARVRDSITLWSAWAAPWRGAAAGAAQPLRLDRRTADAEAGLFRRPCKDRGDVVVLHLDHPAALAADQELRGVRMALALGVRGAAGNAADKGRQPLDAMDQPLLQQEIQRAINRRAARRRAGSGAAGRAGRRRPSARRRPGSGPARAGAARSAWRRDARRPPSARSSRHSVRREKSPAIAISSARSARRLRSQICYSITSLARGPCG